jgi:uncharacterized protein YlxW (UPF0749 family)
MNKRNIFLFLLCVAIGFGIVLQGRVTEGQSLFVSAKAVSDYETTIESEKKTIEATQKLIDEARLKLSAYSQEEAGETDEKELLEKLEKERVLYGMYSAAYDLEGPGVIITIDDGTRELFEGEDLNNVLVHDADILLVINDLKRNGAEAITVNGERLVANSSVICSGYTVEINGVRYARPFEIKAIGDGKRMVSSLIGPGGYGTSLKNWGVLFEIQLSDDIFIPAFTQNLRYVYSQKVEEVEEE